jgi:hypothetical protein
VLKLTNPKTKLSHYLEKIIGKEVGDSFMNICEILRTTHLVSGKNIHVLHLFENKEEFIEGFQHYCKNKNIRYEWNAIALKDDKERKGNWIWGIDGTGDLTNPLNISTISLEKYDIITSDSQLHRLSYSIEDDFLQLFLCQITTIVSSLKVGGNTVFKCYLPITQPLNLSLYQLIYSVFNKVYYYKPTPISTTDEFYIVGIGFKGISEEMTNKLMEHIQEYKNEMLYETIDKQFYEKHLEALMEIVEYTRHMVNRHIILTYYFDKSIHGTMLEKKLIDDTKKWINKYL